MNQTANQTADVAGNQAIDIGLALSGGGYRATAFHFGVVSALNELNLLNRVKWVSGASGGTLLAAMLAVHQCRASSTATPDWFGDFEQAVRSLLSTNLIKASANTLRDNPTLIMAASAAYAQWVGETTLGDLDDAGCDAPSFAFNTTEMRYGLRFPFFARLKPQHSRIRKGNSNVRMTDAARRQVRVRDAMAASSCFPGGFEPMVFPDDFAGVAQQAGDAFEPRNGVAQQRSVAVMDGGIIDNLGATELVRLAKPAPGEQAHRVLIVSDVDRAFGTKHASMGSAELIENGFWRRQALTLPRWLNALRVKDAPKLMNAAAWVGLLAAAFSIASAVGIIASADTAPWITGAAVGAAVLVSAPAALIALANVSLQGLIRRAMANARAATEVDIWKSFGGFSVQTLAQFLSERLSSTLSLTSGVFMKRIRSFHYADLNRGAENHTLVAANIYELITRRRDDLPAPVAERVERAWKMPTTLWFEADGASMDDVIFAGRLTLIKNLLDEAQKEDAPALLAAKKGALESAWTALTKTP